MKMTLLTVGLILATVLAAALDPDVCRFTGDGSLVCEDFP